MTQPFIIAEVGQAHEGSLDIFHSYIDALADTGVNAVKFNLTAEMFLDSYLSIIITN